MSRRSKAPGQRHRAHNYSRRSAADPAFRTRGPTCATCGLPLDQLTLHRVHKDCQRKAEALAATLSDRNRHRHQTGGGGAAC